MTNQLIIYLTYAYNEDDKIVIINCHYTYTWNKEQCTIILEQLANKQYNEVIKQCQIDNIIKADLNSKFVNIFRDYIGKLYTGVISFKGDIPLEIK